MERERKTEVKRWRERGREEKRGRERERKSFTLVDSTLL